MSADNYYTVKKDENGKYVPRMGFMSNLDSGFGADIRPSDPRFDTWKEAADSIHDNYSEYGFIVEPDDSELKPLRDAFIEQWGDPDDLTGRYYD